jgi:hypothetical protein
MRGRRSFLPAVKILVLSVAVLVSFSSCVTTAVVCTAIDVNDRVQSKKSKAQLWIDYIDAKTKYFNNVGNGWVGESEKDLVYKLGSPNYAQEFDNREKLLIYESKAVTLTTTGGNSTSTYNTYLKQTYTTREDEKTTTAEAKGIVKVTLINGKVNSVASEGNFVQLEKILMPSTTFAQTDAYKNDLADCKRKESAYIARASMGALLPYLWGGAIGEVLSIVLIANM